MIGEDLARLLTGPFLAACALLAVAGASKLARPSGARAAARGLDIPAGSTGVRVLGAFELAVALSGALFGGRAAVAVAVCYGAFLVLTALRLPSGAELAGQFWLQPAVKASAAVLLTAAAFGFAAVASPKSSKSKPKSDSEEDATPRPKKGATPRPKPK